MLNVVVNTTPIISLSHIGKLDILRSVYSEIYIPKAVYDEICAKKNSKARIELEKSFEWISIVEIRNQMAKAFYKSQLHDGEVEVMILGKEIDSKLLIIDDKNAKKHAKYLGFNTTGTLGVLIKAKRMGYIEAVRPLLDSLVSEGIYLNEKIIEMCLDEAGEK